jgi:hypothetical protein
MLGTENRSQPHAIDVTKEVDGPAASRIEARMIGDDSEA